MLFTMRILRRSGLLERPESEAMIATSRELGGSPKRLYRMVAFWASRTEMPPRFSSAELPCTSLYSMSASPAVDLSPTRSKRIPARRLLTTRSRIRGVWTARHDEVWVEALKLLIDLGKPADGHLYVRTEITQGSLQRVGVDAVGFFVGDQDPHVAFLVLTLVSAPPDGGEDLRKGNVLGEHLDGAGT